MFILCIGVPQIFNDGSLNIVSIDYTIAVGELTDPCIYQFNRSYALVCNASGVPAPQLTWYYQEMVFGEVTMISNRTNGIIQYYVDNSISVVVISNLTRNNSGLYICNATNDIGFHQLTAEPVVTCTYYK